MYLCVRGIDLDLSLSTISPLHCGTVPTLSYLLFFKYISNNIYMYLKYKTVAISISCLIGCFEEYLTRNWMITYIALTCCFLPSIHNRKQYLAEKPYEFTQYFIKVNQTSLFFWFYFVKIRTSSIVGNGKIVVWNGKCHQISNNKKVNTNQQIMLPSFWNDRNK